MNGLTIEQHSKSQKILIISFYVTFFFTTLGSLMGSITYNLHIAGDAGSKLFILYKYAYFFIFFIFSVFIKVKYKKLYLEDYYITSYLILIGFYAAYYLSNSLPFSYFLYAYTFPIFIFYTGVLFSNLNIDLSKSFIRIQKIYVFYLLFGFFDYFLFGNLFWADIANYASYIVNVKQMPVGTMQGLPGNFFYDPYGAQIRRYVSVFGAPLTFGYFSMIMLALFIIHKPFDSNLKNKLYLYALLFAMLLSITRAVYISMFIALIFVTPIRSYLKVSIYIFTITIMNVFLYYADAIFNTISYSDSSAAGHVGSFYDFIESIGLLELVFGNINLKVIQFEPAIYNFLFFFGITGLFFWLMWFLRISFNVFTSYKSLTWLSIAGLTTMIFFSQSFLSITSSWLAWFLLGYYNQVLLNGSTLRKKTTGN